MSRRNWWTAVFMLLVAAGSGVFWLATAPKPAFSEGQLSERGDPERGRLVFAAGDCASCHASPGQSDRLRLGGGLALASPYGTFRPPNISPDIHDGIGGWSVADLGNALLAGVSPAGAHYYPAFPYTSYTHMEVSDVQDLMAYLRTLVPVSGKAPPHDLSWVFRIRRVLGLWKLMFLERGPLSPDNTHDQRWHRGRYLAEGLSHCAECHSSRNMFGAIRSKTRYAGAVDPSEVGYIPNITPARIGHWSIDEIARMLKTGETPEHGRVGSSMTEVVTNTAQLPEEDRLALATYIKSLPAIPTEKP